MSASADIYQNEYDGSLFSIESKVTDEIWENQRWQPGFGYCALFAGSNNYSDFYGINTGVPPSLNPPPGWRWISDWEVDLKGNYGSVDEEGWLYGSSFERLLISMKNKKAIGIRSQSSLVRRRRWIRSRICKTQEAQQGHMSRIEFLQNSRSRLETTLRDKKDDVKKVLFFEKARHQAYSEIATTSYQTLLESPIILQRCIRKLQRLKTFLQEKAALDREHFKHLESFTSKYNPEETLTTEKKITRTSNLPPLPLDPASFISDVSGGLNISSVTTAAVGMIEATVNSAAKAFYSINCLGEGVVSKRIYHLATTIVDQILLDLDTLLADFTNTLKDAKQKVLRYKDKFRITDELTVRSAEAVATAFESCRLLAEQELWNIRYELQLYGIDTVDCFWSSRNPLMNQKLFHNDITEPPKASSSSPGRIGLTAMTSGSSLEIISSSSSILDQPVTDSENNDHEEDPSSASSPTATGTAVRDDVWLRVQIYRRAVVTIRDELHRLASQATRGKLRVDHLMNRARLFYLGTIQLFVHEQVLAWTEAAEFLKKMGTDIGMAGGPNTLTYNPHSASYVTVNAHQNLPPSHSNSTLGNSSTENGTITDQPEHREQREEVGDGDDSEEEEVLELPLPPLPTSSAVVLQSTLRVRKLDSSHLVTSVSSTTVSQTSTKSLNDSSDSNSVINSNGNTTAATNGTSDGNASYGSQRSSVSLEIHPIRTLQAFLSISASSTFRIDSTTTPTTQSNQHEDYGNSNSNSSDLLGISMSKATEGFSELFRLSSSSSRSLQPTTTTTTAEATTTTATTSTAETQDDQTKDISDDSSLSGTPKKANNTNTDTNTDTNATIAIDTANISSTTTSTTISAPSPSPSSDLSKHRQSSQQDSIPASSRPSSNTSNPAQAFSGGIPDFFRKASSNIPEFFRKANPVSAATSRIRFSIDSNNYQPDNATTTTPNSSANASANGVLEMKRSASSGNESNGGQPEVDFDVHCWTTVRAIVTTDGMLHLFQPRIDTEMAVNSLLSPLVRSLAHSSQSMVTIEDDSLLLLKSIYIKKCTVLPVDAASASTAISIRYPSDVTTLGASLLGLLNNKLSGGGGDEGIQLLTRDESEAQQWRTILTDPLPLSKQITSLPADPSFHPSQYSTATTTGTTTAAASNPLFRTTSSGEQSPSRLSFDRRDSMDSSPDSPLDNKIPDFRSEDIVHPGSPKSNDNNNNNNNIKQNPPVENEKKASSTRNTPMRPKSFNNRLSHRNRNIPNAARMIPLPHSSSTSDSSWIRTQRDAMDPDGSSNSNSSTQQDSQEELGEHSLSFHPIPIRVPRKERGPKQIIPFSSCDANMPLALKRSDYIQTYEKGLEEEKHRTSMKMLENKNKALNEYTLSVEGELIPEDEMPMPQLAGHGAPDHPSQPPAETFSDSASSIATTAILPPNESDLTAAATSTAASDPSGLTQLPPARVRKSRIRELRQSWQKADSMSFLPFIEEATALSRQDAIAAASASAATATATAKSHAIMPTKTSSTVSSSSSLFHSTSSDDVATQPQVEDSVLSL